MRLLCPARNAGQSKGISKEDAFPHAMESFGISEHPIRRIVEKLDCQWRGSIAVVTIGPNLSPFNVRVSRKLDLVPGLAPHCSELRPQSLYQLCPVGSSSLDLNENLGDQFR